MEGMGSIGVLPTHCSALIQWMMRRIRRWWQKHITMASVLGSVKLCCSPGGQTILMQHAEPAKWQANWHGWCDGPKAVCYWTELMQGCCRMGSCRRVYTRKVRSTAMILQLTGKLCSSCNCSPNCVWRNHKPDMQCLKLLAEVSWWGRKVM